MSTIPPTGQGPSNLERAVPPAQPRFLPADDPLVPADFNGWFERVLGVVRRSFAQLAILQVIVAATSVMVGVVTVLITSDLVAGPVRLTGFLIMFVVGAYVSCASVFVVIRDAAGQRTTAAEGLRRGASRARPLLGWGLLAGILAGLGFVALILPGVYLAIVFSVLSCVVVVERAGIERCFTLVNPRFFPTAGRVLLAAFVGIAYYAIVIVCFVIVVLLTGGYNLSALVISAVLQPILLIPLGVVATAVVVVTYAELRVHERGVTTGTLVAELTGIPAPDAERPTDTA